MTLILCILDGWGHSEKQEFNAVYQARTPNFDNLIDNHQHSLLKCSGEEVGLPEGQMGNSEVGHITIGAGRIIYQDLPKISKAFEENSVNDNPVLQNLISDLKISGKACHLLGLISDGGVHSHINHLIGLHKILSEHGIKVHVHGITDGRDVSPHSAKSYVEKLQNNNINLSTISGRYYAMDRDKRWDRTEIAYNNIVKTGSEKFSDAISYIDESYAKDVTDEFIVPAQSENYEGMQNGDAVLITNFRADRVRQISAALCDEKFDIFSTHSTNISNTIGMTEYSKDLSQNMSTLFKSNVPVNSLGEIISQNGHKQLRAAETEKYAHVTYFLNGGREEPFDGEDRIMIPSPKVATYDLQPEMSAQELTEKLLPKIEGNEYEFICVNFANPDMVGHSGNIEATVKAVETVDECLGKIMSASQTSGADLLVTADHGNAEQMKESDSDQPLTSHTLNPVSLIYFGKKNISLKDGGLSNIAPTILQLMEIEKPKDMDRESLVI